MAVTITKQTTPAAVAGSGNTVTFTGAAIGTASNDRMIVVAVTSEDATAAAVTKVTVAGVAIVQCVAAQFTAMNASLWWGNIGTGTTADIVVTYTGTAPGSTANLISVFAVTGARPSLSTFGSHTSTDMDVTAPLTLATVIPASGGAIAVACGATSSSAAKTWAGITEAEEVATTAYCHTTATSTTSGSPTITCTGGTNGEDGALAVAVFATADGKPQNRQTEWINAVPPRQPRSLYEFINPGLGVRTVFVPDTTNLPTGAGWGPPKPPVQRKIDPNSWLSTYYPQLSVAPFAQKDWPTPRGFATKDGTWINPGIRGATQDPFRQTEWPNPRPAPKASPGFAFSIPPDTTAYMPSSAAGWDTPRGPRPQQWQQPANLLPLASVQVSRPFNQFDWTKKPYSIAQDVSWVDTGVRTVTEAATTSLPFNQFDWPKPKSVKPTQNSWDNGLPPIQYVSRAPLVSVPKPRGLRTNDFVQSLNLSIATVVPQTPPPRNYDWPLPYKAGRPVSLTWTQSAFPPPAADTTTYLPASGAGWPNPLRVAQQTVSFTTSGLALTSVVAQDPFRPTDWTNPQRARFGGVSWSQSPQPQPSADAPFSQSDWQVPHTTARLDLSWSHSPHALLRPNPQPFAQADWSNARPGLAQPPSYAQSINLPIATFVPGPTPFNQTEWPSPYGRVTPLALRTLIGQSTILFYPPPEPSPPDFPPHETPPTNDPAGIRSKTGRKKPTYRSYRFYTEQEIEELTGPEIRQAARDLREDVRKDPLAEEVQKEAAALRRMADVLSDIDRLESSVAELTRAIEFATEQKARAQAEAQDDEEAAALLL